jgi:hypothetical protein
MGLCKEGMPYEGAMAIASLGSGMKTAESLTGVGSASTLQEKPVRQEEEGSQLWRCCAFGVAGQQPKYPGIGNEEYTRRSPSMWTICKFR